MSYLFSSGIFVFTVLPSDPNACITSHWYLSIASLQYDICMASIHTKPALVFSILELWNDFKVGPRGFKQISVLKLGSYYNITGCLSFKVFPMSLISVLVSRSIGPGSAESKTDLTQFCHSIIHSYSLHCWANLKKCCNIVFLTAAPLSQFS